MAISRKPEGVPSVIEEMISNCVELAYNNYIIQEFPPLVPGGDCLCFVLNPRIIDRDKRGVAFRRTVDECMEIVDEYNEQDGVTWEHLSPQPDMPLYLLPEEMFKRTK